MSSDALRTSFLYFFKGFASTSCGIWRRGTFFIAPETGKEARVNYENLDNLDLCRYLKEEDTGAWLYVLERIIAQEKKSLSNSRKRFDWRIRIEDLLGELYEDMVSRKKLDHYKGTGSLIGWMRIYLRGYLNRRNPNTGIFEPLDTGWTDEEGNESPTLEEKISFEESEKRRLDPYTGEDLQVLQHENWTIASQCFAELWQKNSIQAYVMLLKARFHMSSLEIKERLGISSTANVDQLYSRAVKQMRATKEKYDK